MLSLAYKLNGFLQKADLEQFNNGKYGTWGIARYCDSGYYARGFKIKVFFFQLYASGIISDLIFFNHFFQHQIIHQIENQ